VVCDYRMCDGKCSKSQVLNECHVSKCHFNCCQNLASMHTGARRDCLWVKMFAYLQASLWIYNLAAIIKLLCGLLVGLISN